MLHKDLDEYCCCRYSSTSPLVHARSMGRSSMEKVTHSSKETFLTFVSSCSCVRFGCRKEKERQLFWEKKAVGSVSNFLAGLIRARKRATVLIPLGDAGMCPVLGSYSSIVISSIHSVSHLQGNRRPIVVYRTRQRDGGFSSIPNNHCQKKPHHVVYNSYVNNHRFADV